MAKQELTKALRPGPECPSLEELGRHADGALAPEERRRTESHVAACANCQAELALLHEFATHTARDGEAEVVRWGVERLREREPQIFADRAPAAAARPGLPRNRLRVPMAAVVLLAVAGGYYLADRRAPRLPTDIGAGPETVRALGITARAPIGDQTVVPVRLQWQPVGGAARYRVRLTEVDREELWSADTTDAEIALPADARTRIVPGKTLVWQVTAYDAAGAALARSNDERFRLVR